MSTEARLILFAIAAPAAVAFAVAGLWQRLLPGDYFRRLALPVAVAMGFVAGCWLLGDLALAPQRHRQWLPYLACAAALCGRSSAPSTWSWIAWALLAALSSWLLVPSWDSLWPPRLEMVPLLTAYLLLLTGGLASLPPNTLGRLFAGMLSAAAAVTALLIVIGVSIKIGESGLAAAAALTGSSLSLFLRRSRADAIPLTQALAPVFSVLVGGLAFVGTIDPQVPLPIILLAPAAPLALWLFAVGPLARLQGWKVACLQSLAVLVPLTFALVWLLLA